LVEQQARRAGLWWACGTAGQLAPSAGAAGRVRQSASVVLGVCLAQPSRGLTRPVPTEHGGLVAAVARGPENTSRLQGL